jgi:DNA-binding IclR family transcriptional regulator
MNGQQSNASDRSGIQVIARAAALLRAVENEPSGLSLGELAARLGLARSTVQRIVSALVDEGFLISAGPRNGVTLGPALARLAAAAVIDTERLVRPVLQSLSVATGETVDLSMLQGSSAVFLDQVMGSSRLVAVSAVGETFPLHCTANGKALLSRLPRDKRDRLLTDPLKRYTARTITDRDVLSRQIADIAATGIAWDNEEHSDGICAVGASFIDPIGRDFALSIPVPASRFDAKRDELAEQLRDAIATILRTIPGTNLNTAA